MEHQLRASDESTSRSGLSDRFLVRKCHFLVKLGPPWHTSGGPQVTCWSSLMQQGYEAEQPSEGARVHSQAQQPQRSRGGSGRQAAAVRVQPPLLAACKC